MKPMEMSSVKTIAFYGLEELQTFLMEVLDSNQLVGLDLAVEKPDIEDPRTVGNVTIYVVTLYYDLMLDTQQ